MADGAGMTYVYLHSVEHSGSTLIACLVGAHPEVSGVGEFGTPFSPDGNCSCGATYAACGFWSAWIEEARAQGVDFALGRPGINLLPAPGGGRREDLFYHLFPSGALDRARDLLFPAGSPLARRARAAVDKSERLARILCDMEGSRVFFDSTKNSLQIPFLARHLTSPLKVVSLVRDGRGVMNSLIEKEKYTPEQAVAAWMWGNRNLQRAERYVAPAHLFRVRLEDLCREPEATLRALFHFLEVDPDVRLDYADRSRRHIVGNRMRHVFTGEIRSDESWRGKLSPELLALFERRAGALNRSLGYTD